MKRGPKGDLNPQKGPLGDPGTLKGTHCVTVGVPILETESTGIPGPGYIRKVLLQG